MPSQLKSGQYIKHVAYACIILLLLDYRTPMQIVLLKRVWLWMVNWLSGLSSRFSVGWVASVFFCCCCAGSVCCLLGFALLFLRVWLVCPILFCWLPLSLVMFLFFYFFNKEGSFKKKKKKFMRLVYVFSRLEYSFRDLYMYFRDLDITFRDLFNMYSRNKLCLFETY